MLHARFRVGADTATARYRPMRSLGTSTITLIVTAVLALLLIGYVFLGDGRDSGSSQPRCSTREAYDQIKRELFRRAVIAHPAKAPVLRQVADYSLVRRNSQVRRRSGDSGTVKCAGSIALELPPGVAVVGGRRSLAANVSYTLSPRTDGSLQLISMSKADPIVVPLGALVDARAQAQPPLLAPTDDQTAAEPPLAPAPPTRASPEPPEDRTATAPARPAVRQPIAKPAPQPAPTQRSAPATAKRPANSGATSNRVTAPAVVARPGTTNPSFNCRYARTRGEIAVCRDPGLASLDRQMAGQFNRAMAAASPGARLILQRSRTRFLRYRDSCGTDACIADAYYGRMREISDIASRY